MNKRLQLLSVLSILAVVINHAAGWGQVTMVLWTHRYLPVTVPNYDSDGTFAYYSFLIIRQTTQFAVPAFLFISGIFIAYALHSAKMNSTIRILKRRLKNLLIPYAIWSVIFLAFYWITGEEKTMLQYLVLFFTKGIDGTYFYVPLLCYLYLLSPILLWAARKDWQWFLVSSVLIQLITLVPYYLRLAGVSSPVVENLIIWIPAYAFPRWIFFFSLGITVGYYGDQTRIALSPYKPFIIGSTVIFLILSIVEAEVLYRLGLGTWHPTAFINHISFQLFSIFFLLSFMTLSQTPMISTKFINHLGSKSYGIYLTHYLSMTLIAKIIYHFAPWILSQEWLFQPIMLTAGFGIPLTMMFLSVRFQTRSFSRFLFG